MCQCAGKKKKKVVASFIFLPFFSSAVTRMQSLTPPLILSCTLSLTLCQERAGNSSDTLAEI